jgi:hypothetical protein
VSVEVRTRCPLCDTEGWVTFARLNGFMAMCGTSWGAGLTEPKQSPCCAISAGLRFEVAILRMTGGVAA